jgi:hypothetical protein
MIEIFQAHFNTKSYSGVFFQGEWDDRMNDKENGDNSEQGRGAKEAVKDFFYGMAMQGMARYALKTRMYLEQLFMLITLGDMLGIPILPPYYSLKLLPYAVPNIKTWKRTLFKERDFTDALF